LNVLLPLDRALTISVRVVHFRDDAFQQKYRAAPMATGLAE
jgi:hypothetical protein